MFFYKWSLPRKNRQENINRLIYFVITLFKPYRLQKILALFRNGKPMLRKYSVGIAFAALTILASCNGGGDAVTSEPSISIDAFPLSVGSTWQYNLSYRGAITARPAVSITGTRTVNGTKIYVLGTGDTEYANYARIGSEILAFPPPNTDALTLAIGPVVILKLPLRPGDKWVQVDKTLPYEDGTISVYTEITVREPEDVVTPAGYFKGAYPVYTKTVYTISTTRLGTGFISDYNKIEWIALGVGVVARNDETLNTTNFAPGKFERLTSYNIAKN